jgi:hypothetical protein
MSVQGSPIARLGNQFFDQLPDDAVRSVFEFLKTEDGSLSIDHLFMRRADDRNIGPNDIGADDRTVVATSAVCRNWRDNAVLQETRQEAATRLHQRANLQSVHREMRQLNEYPPEMVRVFRNSRTPISQLPVLDLGDRMGGTFYIDFIQPADMTHSVMRFRDQHGRPGIALKIHASRRIALQARLDRIREMASYVRDDLRQGNLSSLRSLARVTARTVGRFLSEGGHDVVLAPFKRFTDPESTTWSYGWGNSDNTIEDLYNARHNNNGHVGPRIMACPNCPFVGRTIHPTVFSDLLNGRDADFSLPGHNGVHPGDQAGVRNSGMSQRTIVVTALAALMIAYLVNYYFASERSSV